MENVNGPIGKSNQIMQIKQAIQMMQPSVIYAKKTNGARNAHEVKLTQMSL